MISRRNFIKVAGLSLLAPSVFAAPATKWDRVLLLVELKGGNDGLNTIIPYTDKNYYQLRPNLSIQKNQVLQLSDKVGLNPVMEKLMPLWEDKEMAIVQSVGYSEPNRSHFRSIEIWESGSDSDEFLEDGWIAQLFAQNSPPGTSMADGILLDQDSTGPLTGINMRNIAMRRPRQFIEQAKRLKDVMTSTQNPALRHVLSVQSDIHQAADSLEKKLETLPPLTTKFPSTPIGNQLATAANLLRLNIQVPVIKVSHGGFDTHSNQRGKHNRLLQQLSDGLAAFRNEMKQNSLWERALVMTYSEFGRRAYENGSTGTDHGTAAPHFFMGGKVKGGIYGEPSSLDNLSKGDLRYNIDFRSLYGTVAQKWWSMPYGFFQDKKYPLVDCLG